MGPSGPSEVTGGSPHTRRSSRTLLVAGRFGTGPSAPQSFLHGSRWTGRTTSESATRGASWGLRDAGSRTRERLVGVHTDGVSPSFLGLGAKVVLVHLRDLRYLDLGDVSIPHHTRGEG